jgi:hypothetical protein
MPIKPDPHIVYMYKNGCPHCERATPLWKDATKQVPPGIAVIEIEANDLPQEVQSRVEGFPRFERTGPDGVIVIEFEGAPMTAKELKKKLKLHSKGAGTRRRGRGRKTRRRRA